MAGSSMKDIKLRIKSVESTMQITKAMQLVATSKLRRAKEHMELSKPYAEIAEQAIQAAAASCVGTSIPYVTPREVKKRCFVMIAGDRGLAGGYNNNMFKLLRSYDLSSPCCVMPVGRKAIDRCQHDGLEILSDSFDRVEGMSVSACFKMARLLTEGYDNGDFDEIVLLYTDFKSMLSQQVASEVLLPIPKPETPVKPQVVTVYEPEASDMLRCVMDDFIAGRLYSAICDSYASEVAARRNAMNSATTNAEAMISDLKLRYNRARQSSITQEITEIVAGAEH